MNVRHNLSCFVSFLCLVGGCGKGDAPQHAQAWLFSFADLRPDGLTVDGIPATRAKGYGKFSYTAAPGQDITQATLVAKQDAACGEVTIPVIAPTELDLERTRKYAAGGAASVSLLPKSVEIPTATIHIDNRASAAEATVVIGDASMVAPAGQTVTKRLPLGSCSSEISVSIEGRKIGELPATAASKSFGIAAMPGRCYRQQTVDYKTKELNRQAQFDRAMNKATGKAPAPPKAATDVPKGQRVFRLDGVDVVFKAPPKTLESMGVDSTLTVLDSVPCL